jgi:hypothetical protein
VTEPSTTLVGDVPVAHLQPDVRADRPPLALWLPHLTGTKEDCIPVLQRLAAAGYLAISIDPCQHGERAHESGEVATPDWTRPGMRALLDADRLVDQGPAGSEARSFYDRLCDRTAAANVPL